MLSKIRKNLRAFSIPLWIVAASFVGTIFLVWGRNSVMGPSGSEVATVNGEGISVVDFQREYQSVVNRLKQQFGENFRKFVKDEDIKRIALSNLINRALLLQAAREEGLRISDEAVAREIESIPAFQVNGTFSVKLYKEFLRARKLTPKAFEDSIREDLLIRKVLAVVDNAPSVTDYELKALYRKVYGMRKFRYKLFPVTDFNPEVSEEEMRKYYEENKAEFAEKREEGYFVLTFPKEKEEEAAKAYKLAKEGKVDELSKLNPVEAPGWLVEKAKGKDYYFTSSGGKLYVLFKKRKEEIKPFEEVKKEIEEKLRASKALKMAREAAEKYSGTLDNETDNLDVESFTKEFSPLDPGKVSELFRKAKVGERVVVPLLSGYGLFSPETELSVKSFDEEKLEKLKQFIIGVKRETD
ncbi:MAG: SurA N-terminal domain-containing protein, partial [Desulfurobacteriaceae bacterium]